MGRRAQALTIGSVFYLFSTAIQAGPSQWYIKSKDRCVGLFSKLLYRESRLQHLGKVKWFLPNETVKERRMKLIIYVHEAYGAPDIMDTKAQRNAILSLVDRLAALEEKFSDQDETGSDLRIFNARFWGKFADTPPPEGVDSDNSFLFTKAGDATVSEVFRYLNENRGDIGLELDEHIGSKVERRWIQHSRLPLQIAGGLMIGSILLNWINSVVGNLIEAPRELVASDARRYSFEWQYGSSLSFDPKQGAISLEERRKALREITMGGDLAYSDYDLHGRQIAMEVPAFVSSLEASLIRAAERGDRSMVNLVIFDLVMLDADAREFTNSPWGAVTHERIERILARYDPDGAVRRKIYSGKFLELMQEVSTTAPSWVTESLQAP